MFLNQLADNQKNAFLHIAVYAAKSNNKFKDEEKEMINLYCKEMGITSLILDSDLLSMDEIVSVFKDSENKTKRIVLLEILGILFSDGIYDDEEKAFAMDFGKRIGCSNADVDSLEASLIKYIDISNELSSIVNGK